MSRTDFILDFETMGQDASKCPAVDCAIATFDWDRFTRDPYTFEELTGRFGTEALCTRLKLSVADQVKNYGAIVEKSTVQFWESQPVHVRQHIKPLDSDLTQEEFCDTFIRFLADSPKIEYWWSRANVFDPLILWRIMTDCNRHHSLNQYLMFWRVRDTRTFIDAKFNFSTKNGFVPVADTEYWEAAFEEHNSIHDISADIMRLQAIHRAENGLEQVEK
jgi:hypothetical protein